MQGFSFRQFVVRVRYYISNDGPRNLWACGFRELTMQLRGPLFHKVRLVSSFGLQ